MTDPGVNNLATAPTKTCAACGTNNPAAARFCGQCGVILPASAAPGNGASRLLQEARMHLQAGAWEEAALAGEAVLALDATSAEAHHIIARSRRSQGMQNVAVSHAREAVRLDPSNVEYQTDLALLEARGVSDRPQWVPIAVATAIAVMVLAILITLAVAGRSGHELATEPMQPSDFGPTFTPGPPSATVAPQPVRPQGTVLNQPRVQAPRASTQPPGPAARRTQSTAAGSPMPSNTAPSRYPVGLAPAPVDPSALRPFPSTEPEANIQVPSPARSSQEEPDNQPLAPPPLPGGSAFRPGTATTQNYSAPVPVPQPVQPSPAPSNATPQPAPSTQAPRVLPHQQFVQRDYASGIEGYQRLIAEGRATGATYQQLAASYERAGQAALAVGAYQQAIQAFQAQIASGQDAEGAKRGLRSSQQALAILQNRTR